MIHKFENDLPNNLQITGDLAIDTETMGLNLKRDRLCLVQLSNGGEDSYLIKFDKDSNYHAPNLKKLFTNTATTKIFHYARFDVAVIKYYLDIEVKNIFCTKIASKIARTYTDYHGLKDLCRELLGVHISKQQQSSYWGAKQLSKDQEEYATNDVLYLHKLKDALTQMLKNENRFEMIQKIFEFLPTRVDLDIAGWDDLDIFAH
jgi:ribonuclease D